MELLNDAIIMHSEFHYFKKLLTNNGTTISYEYYKTQQVIQYILWLKKV